MAATVPQLAMLWVMVYTAGLTRAQKSTRRDEIQSDMHEQLAFALAQGQGSTIASSVASRTVRGVLADVRWRLEEGRDGEEAVRAGLDPPLPWCTMWFLSAVIIGGCVASTQVETLGDARVLLASFAAGGAGLFRLGLYLATHRLFGPLCITAGAAAIALGLWWTGVAPFVAVGLGISGLRRAGRLDALLNGGS